MYLENLLIDAVEPQRLGRFWEAVVGGERLTDEPDGFETRLTIDGGPCSTCARPVLPARLRAANRAAAFHLDLSGGAHQADAYRRLCAEMFSGA